MEEQLIFFVPSNKTYTLNDVCSTLKQLYGNITSTTIWNSSEEGIWYNIAIKIKNINSELITQFKAELFDNTCKITIEHIDLQNHSIYYEINVCSYKYWLFYNYEEILQKKNNEIIRLNQLNERLTQINYDSIHP